MIRLKTVHFKGDNILPVGNFDTKTDYNYTENLTLRIYNLNDGAKGSRTVCDTDGNSQSIKINK